MANHHADRPLSPGVVADTLGVSAQTLATWSDKGMIRSFRTAGGHRRYRPADVAAFIADRENNTEAAS